MSNKQKLYVIVGILVVCVVWLSYQLATLSGGTRFGTPPTSPAETRAMEINRKLIEAKEFPSIEVAALDASGQRFKVEGIIKRPDQLPKLKDFLAEQAKDAAFEFQVVTP